MSIVCSGNHCRSDPVQVQSTFIARAQPENTGYMRAIRCCVCRGQCEMSATMISSNEVVGTGLPHANSTSWASSPVPQSTHAFACVHRGCPARAARWALSADVGRDRSGTTAESGLDHSGMKTRRCKQKMVPRGLEPRTLWLLAIRSNQLSYETMY